MTIPAIHCEVKKLAYRQSKEGIVVSFLVHPQEVPDALAVAPLGQRYMLALAAISDDETPVDPASQRQPTASPPRSAPAEGSGEGARTDPVAPSPGTSRYRNASPMEQARTRAGILESDLRFQQWVASETGGIATEEHAAAYMRECCCDGQSRKLIGQYVTCHERFLAMETEYRLATGQMAEQRR